MSTDPTQPAQPAKRPQGPQDKQAPPTVQAPVQPSAAPRGQEPSWQGNDATQPVRQWQAPPPPPPPPGARPDQGQAPAARVPQPPPGRSAAPDPTVQDSAPAGWQQQPWQQNDPAQQWSPQPGMNQPGMNQPGMNQPGANQGQWPPAQPPVGPPGQAQGRRRPRRRRVRRSVMALFTVFVLLIVLVIADRVACAVAENEMASQFKTQGFPVKPSVNIEGFPFLTQLAAKDFKKVDISASNVPAGPVTISTVHATINGLHISSFSSNAKATVDSLNATAFISFGALAAAGGLGGGTGITVTQAGPDTLKITAGLGGVFSDTEEAKITQTGAQTITVKVLDNGGAVGNLLSSFGTFSFSLPKGVPASTRITGLTLNSQGLTISAAATDATFSQ